jgi:anti-sigma factor RsiW
MTHEEYETLVSAYVDGELAEVATVDERADFEAHLATCAACSARAAQYRDLSAAIGGELRRQAAADRAPQRLRESVRVALRANDAPRRRQPRFWGAGIGAFAAAAAVVVAFVIGRGTKQTDIAQEILDSHVRSLAGDEAHLMDIVSTDQHTVKPWFNGKLDFAPTVADFKEQGFPLLGGRVDYIDGHRAAALVYGRRQHKINVYEWPADTRAGETNLAGELRLGYSVLHWSHAGMVYWAVSDVNRTDLDELARNIDSLTR